MHGCLSVFGALTGIFSVVFVIQAISDILKGAEDGGTLWGLLVFFSLTGIGGVYLTISSVKKKRLYAKHKKEKDIIGLITLNGGRITPIEVAAQSRYSIDEARAILDDLCARGAGQLRITDLGETVYVFQGIVPEYDKITARSPLDF